MLCYVILVDVLYKFAQMAGIALSLLCDDVQL